jgi:hypothetical protein
LFWNITIRSGSGKASGFTRTVFTTENIAVFVPMPSASAVIAANRKPGCLPEYAGGVLQILQEGIHDYSDETYHKDSERLSASASKEETIKADAKLMDKPVIEVRRRRQQPRLPI